jgi:hypothetical protein
MAATLWDIAESEYASVRRPSEQTETARHPGLRIRVTLQ